MTALLELVRQHGRQLAEKVRLSIRAGDIEAAESSLAFCRELSIKCRDMEARGIHPEQVSEWVVGLSAGYNEWLDEEL